MIIIRGKEGIDPRKDVSERIMYCDNSINCPIFKKYLEGLEKEDVINGCESLNESPINFIIHKPNFQLENDAPIISKPYYCVAAKYLNDSIFNTDVKISTCSKVEELNNIEKILNQLNELLSKN